MKLNFDFFFRKWEHFDCFLNQDTKDSSIEKVQSFVKQFFNVTIYLSNCFIDQMNFLRGFNQETITEQQGRKLVSGASEILDLEKNDGHSRPPKAQESRIELGASVIEDLLSSSFFKVEKETAQSLFPSTTIEQGGVDSLAQQEQSLLSQSLIKRNLFNEIPLDVLKQISLFLVYSEFKNYTNTIKDEGLRKDLLNFFMDLFVLSPRDFGSFNRCNLRYPMPLEMKNILEGTDKELYSPFLKCSYLRVFEDDIETIHKVIVPATYQNIRKVCAKNILKKENPTEKEINQHLGKMMIFDHRIQDYLAKTEQKPLHWVLVTKQVLQQTINHSFLAQKEKLSDWKKENLERVHFEHLKAKDALYAIFWAKVSNLFLYSLRTDNQNCMYARCEAPFEEYGSIQIGMITAPASFLNHEVRVNNLNRIEDEKYFNRTTGLGAQWSFERKL